ncbi:MAG: Re/Si-specific NAD(P)(+) transhydrogenase subunit alpha [Myxococcales bacterium]|nr:Re/Si-specific NAD(P)(+) transhydrogenase subunit alpha [Myxococcales bacterium]
MKIGIIKETFEGECRVAGTPKSIARLKKQGFDVVVESGAGANADFTDDAYREAGAEVLGSAKDVWEAADVLTKVRIATLDEVPLSHEDQVVISMVSPAQNKELIDTFAERKVTLLALDCVPRISRAQSMDVLSSMANIAGYRAVLEAANVYGSFFTGQTTAAGSVPPAKVLIIGAGVAGLAALGAARGLGAIVRAFDTRAAVREQVESLGGEFLEVEFEESGEGGGGYAKLMSPEFIEAEMALFMEQAKEVDIVITTALIPGRKAPTLWTEDHVKAMKPGSVIVDMAAESGGNCECTEHGKAVVAHGVTILGYSDLPSRMARVASDLFGTNISHLTKELGKAEGFAIDHENEITRGALVLDKGEMLWPASKKEAPPAPKPTPKPEPVPEVAKAVEAPPSGAGKAIFNVLALAMAAGWIGLRFGMGNEQLSPELAIFLQHLTVFVLACFVGWQVVWSVTAALHTPLMSVTNAISGIIIVGGILQAIGDTTSAPVLVGAAATLFATINIFGGFFVTKRMLQMFQK